MRYGLFRIKTEVKMFRIFLVISTCICLAACNRGQGGYEPGTYTGEGKGYGGESAKIKLMVNINEDGQMDSIEVDALYETPAIGGQAINKLKEEAIKKNNAELDIVSGATLTSQGFTQALKEALDQAEIK